MLPSESSRPPSCATVAAIRISAVARGIGVGAAHHAHDQQHGTAQYVWVQQRPAAQARADETVVVGGTHGTTPVAKATR